MRKSLVVAQRTLFETAFSRRCDSLLGHAMPFTMLTTDAAQACLMDWNTRHAPLWFLSWPQRLQLDGHSSATIMNISPAEVRLSLEAHPAPTEVNIPLDGAQFGTEEMPFGKGLWIMRPSNPPGRTLSSLDCLIEVTPP